MSARSAFENFVHVVRAIGWSILILAGIAFICRPTGAEEIGPAIDAAEAWLVAQQNADGSLGAFAELQPRDTAQAVLALSGRPGSESEMTESAIYLSGVPETSAEFRALRVLALASAGSPSPELNDSLLGFGSEEGQGPFTEHQPNLYDSSLAIQALGGEESRFLAELLSLLDYVQLHQAVDGGWGYVADAPTDPYFTGEMLAALTSLEELSVGDAVLDSAASYLILHQQADGGFGGDLETAVIYRGLLAADRGPALYAHGSPVPYFLGRQAADGSWGGDVLTTAQVVRVLRQQGPNLVISALDASAESILAGEPLQLVVTVENVGPEPAGAGHLAVHLGEEGGEQIEEIAVPALDIGESTEITVDIDTTTLEESTDFFVLADSRDAVREIDEDDNSETVRVTLRSRPDLALFPADLATSPQSPEPDAPFQLLITARNLGESEVASFGYRVVRRAGGAAEQLATGSAGPLGAGDSSLIAVDLTLPEGEHTLEVELDTAQQVDEEIEENNTSSFVFFVVDPSQPDLAITAGDVVLTPSEPQPGETVDVQVTVRNLGDREATAAVALYQNDPADGGLELARELVTVAGGGSVSVSRTVPLGQDAFSLTVVADPDGSVAELDEANNRHEVHFRELPDLALGFDNFETFPAEPLAGEPVTLVVTVRNAGTETATDVGLTIYDGEPESGGNPIFTHVFPEIRPSGNRVATHGWAAPGGLTELVAVADPDGAEPELSESNNRAVRRVAVPRTDGPNLRIGALDTGGLFASAETLDLAGTVVVTVENAGDADVSEAFQVRLFEDGDGDGRPGSGESVLASTVFDGPLAVGASVEVSLEVDAATRFFHPLAWVEVDAGDVVAEQREDDNRRALYGDCELPAAASGSLELVESWYVPDVNVEAAPLVVQLSDDDGNGRIDSRDTPDLVFHGVDDEGIAIFAVSGLDGSEVWTFRSSMAHPLVNHIAQAAAADLDGDGRVEIVGHQRDGRLLALEHDGSLAWVSDPVPGVGKKGLGGPAVGDLDGDGVPEIVIGRAVVSNTGRLISVGTGNQGENVNYYGPFGVRKVPGVGAYPQSLIADVDLDGTNEVVAGDTVYRLVDGTLEIVWNAEVPDKLMVDGFSAVADLDGDPEAEIVYVSSGQIMTLHHDGSAGASRRVMETFTAVGTNTFWGSAPSIADLDGDGTPEILVSTATHVRAYDAGLQPLWKHAIGDDFGGITGVTAFDLDGDGVMEVLFNDQSTFYVLNGLDGQVLHSRFNHSFTAMEHSVVADVDGDGRADVVLPSSRDSRGDTSTMGIHVFSHPSWRGTRPMWNQYGYSVTNVALDGTVPSPMTPSWRADNVFRANRPLVSPPEYQANLTVSLPRVGEAVTGGVPVLLRVGNGGRRTVAAGAVVELFDADPSTSEPVGRGVTTEELRPGAWEDVEVTWTAASASGLTAHAVVDRAAAVVECDEGDNQVDFLLTETVLPDLQIAADGISMANPALAGQEIAVSVQVENVGSAVATPFVLRLYDDRAFLGPVVGESEVGEIAAGAELTVDVRFDTLGLGGLHLIHAVADPEGAVLELREDNNEAVESLELVSPTRPDLSMTGLTVDPDLVTAGEEVLLRAEVVNRGTLLPGGFDTAFTVNGAEAGRILSAADLASGEVRIVDFTLGTTGRIGKLTLEAVLDPDDVVAEENEGNNVAPAGLVVESSGLSVEVATDRLSYGPNEDVAVEVRPRNQGDALTVGLAVKVIDSAGALVATLAEESLELGDGTLTLPYVYDTGSSPPGGYAVLAELSTEFSTGAGVEARDSTAFTVEREIAATARLFSNRDVYGPGQEAIFTGRVENSSANYTLTDAVATLQVTDGGGNEVFSSSWALPMLVPGGDLPVQDVWPIDGAAPGTYVASLSLRDVEDLLVAYDSVALEVEDSAETGAGLEGTLSVAPDPVAAGAPLEARFEATNGGNADMDDLQLRVDLLDGDSETLLASAAEPFSLARNDAARGAFGFDTTDLAPGTHLAALVAVLPDGPVRLDRVLFEVVPGLSVADASVDEGDDGSRTLFFTVSLSQALADAVSVDFATADGTATAGVDYEPTFGSLTFAAGETGKTVGVTVYGDLDGETDEDVLLVLSNATGVSLGDDVALGTIRDEEGCASPDLLVGGDAEDAATFGAWSSEGGSWPRRFGAPPPLSESAYLAPPPTVFASELVQVVDLGAYANLVDGAGQELHFSAYVRNSGGDGGSAVGSVTVEYLDASGEVVLDAFVSEEISGGTSWVPVVDRRVVPAGTRHARIRLAAEALDATELDVYFDRVALRSLGTPTLDVADVEWMEGNADTTAASFAVELSCPLPVDLVVDQRTADDTALADSDYVPVDGNQVIPAGTTTTAFEVEVVGDTIDEPTERFFLDVSLADPEVVLLRQRAEATIIDDDGPATISVADVQVTEADAAEPGEARLPVELSAPSGKSVQVSWSTEAGTATQGDDFQAASGTLTFAHGAVAAEIAVRLAGDRVHEIEESFDVVLSAPQNAVLGKAAATVTIRDDDPAEISVADVVVEEGDGETMVSFPVSLSLPSDVEVRVQYATEDREALAGTDYLATSGELVFAPGDTEASVEVTLVTDRVQEVEETFRLVLSAPVEGTLADPEGVATIIDEDGILFTALDAQVVEGDDASSEVLVSVVLNKAAETDVSVDYATVSETAEEGTDFLATSGALLFPAGTTRLDVPVTVLGDLDDEGVETFVVRLSNAVDARIVDADGRVTILEGDGWHLNRSVDAESTPGCIELGHGSAWRSTRIDLRENFDKTLRFFLGGRHSRGAVFTLQNEGPEALGGGGHRLGYSGIQPSVGLEIDLIRDISPDPLEDHLAILLDGALGHDGHEPVFAREDGSDLTDGREHLLRVTWNAETRTLDAHLDGDERLIYRRNIATEILGQNEVFYGVTGALSGGYVCETATCHGTSDNPLLALGDAENHEGDEGTTTLSFPLTLSCPTDHDVTVDFATREVTAVAGVDYLSASGSVTIPAGEMSAWIRVEVIGDLDSEGEKELIEVGLSNASGGEIRYGEAVGTIRDDDLTWHFNGRAVYSDDNCVELTNTRSRGYASSAWRTKKVDLTRHFDKTFRVHPGNMETPWPGEGMAFVLQSEGAEALGGEHTLGYGQFEPIEPSLLVEIDTESNKWEPPFDHLAIARDGHNQSLHNLHPPVRVRSDLDNVKDGRFHDFRVVWNGISQTLDIRFDGERRIFHSVAAVDEIFGGDPEVFFGWTAGNSLDWNHHEFCEVDACYARSDSPAIHVGDAETREGDGGTASLYFPVTLSCPADHPVSVGFATVDGTARAGEDYEAQSGTLTFAPGETSATVEVPVVGDVQPEPLEHLSLSLSDAEGGEIRYSTAEGRIVSDDIQVEAARARFVEGTGPVSSVGVDLELQSVPFEATTVDYSLVSGSAVVGEDVVAATGTLEFGAGETQKSLRIDLMADALPEADETFTLLLENSHLVSDVGLELVILDDDDCPSGNLLENGGFEEEWVDDGPPGWTVGPGGGWTLRSQHRFEGEYSVHAGWGVVSAELYQEVDVSGFSRRIDAGRQAFAITGKAFSNKKSPDEAQMVVEYRDETGEILEAHPSRPVRGGDYWRHLSLPTVPPEGTRSIRVRLLSRRIHDMNNDAFFDGVELRALRSPMFSVADVKIEEGEAGLTVVPVEVTLSCPHDRPVQVSYLTVDGTATVADGDYLPAVGILEFPPGETSATIKLEVVGDTLEEGTEMFSLVLSDPVNAGLFDRSATVTIQPDEVVLLPGDLLPGETIQVHEGDEGSRDAVFTFRLSEPSDLPIELGYRTVAEAVDGGVAATPGVDYEAASGSVTFAPGETEKQVAVRVLGDEEVEEDESFLLELFDPVNVAIPSARLAAEILDDDVGIYADNVSVTEGDVASRILRFPVRLTRPSAHPVTVSWETADVSAVAGEDYVAASGVLTFEPGEVRRDLELEIESDEAREQGEYFEVALSDPVGGTLARTAATVFILDDDDCPGPNLVANGGADEEMVLGEIPGWEEATGTGWHSAFPPAHIFPLDGIRYFFPGFDEVAELRQDVSIQEFARWIDRGAQRFLFQGFVSSEYDEPADEAQIVVEYRDAANENVLASFDSGKIADTERWQSVSDLRTVPPGARWVRIRLIGHQRSGDGRIQAYFESISLRPMQRPVLTVDSPWAEEGNSVSREMVFEVELSCSAEETITVDYVTRQESARDWEDFIPTAGTLVFEPGTLRLEVRAEVLGDLLFEEAEHFQLDLAPVSSVARAVNPGIGTIVDDESFSDDHPFVTLATAAGDGQVSIDVGAYGDWGSWLMDGIRNMPNNGNSYLDPPGRRDRVGTTWESDIYLRHPGHAEVFLTSQLERPAGSSPPLPRPGFIDHGPTHAMSSFVVGGLHFLLKQSLEDLFVDGVRVGGRLIQHYSITNRLQVPATFEIFRYHETDIAGAGDDGGGLLEIDAQQFLVATDFVAPLDQDNVLAAMTTEGGRIPVEARYRAAGYHSWWQSHLPNFALDNSVYRDEDGDDWVDRGHDIGLAMRNEYIDLAPGASTTYRTITYFGGLPASEFDPNAPPHAEAGVYRVEEGSTLQLDGSASYDTDGNIVAHDWDLDGDGTFDDASGPHVSVTYPQETIVPVTLRVTDDEGLTATGDGSVLVVNAPPTISITLPPTMPAGIDGQVATFSDPGVLDLHTAVIDWGDGTEEPGTVVEADGSGTITGIHTYAEPGEYVVEVCATDDLGDSGCERSIVLVEESGEPELRATKSDALADDRDADGVPSPGDVVEYTIAVENAGDGEATEVVLRDLVPDHTALVAGSVTTDVGTVLSEDPIEVDLGTLGVGTTATVSFQVVIDHPFPHDVDDISNQATVESAELPTVLSDDPDVGGEADPTVTMVQASPRLVAEMADALAEDADGDGVPSPGDTLEYTVSLRNLGNTAATGVAFGVPTPEHTTYVAGSASASVEGTATVSIGGEDPLEILAGELPVGDEVTITYQVVVDNPIATGVTRLESQGVTIADGLDDVLTDDPDVGGAADPTVTEITTEPVLAVEKTDVLFTDENGDGVANPGDELLYRLEIASTGNTGATGVVLDDAVPAHTTLVGATVQTDAGTVVSEDPIRIDLGTREPGTTALVTFRVLVDVAFPVDVTQVANQAVVSSTELDPVLSDDPETEAADDSTSTDVFIPTELTVDDVEVTEGDPVSGGLGTSDAVFTVSLSNATNRPVSLTYRTEAESASAGVDFETRSGTLGLAPGETEATLAVPVIGDLIDEPVETFRVVVSEVENATVLDGEGVGTILDDDEPSVVSVGDVQVTEADPGDPAVTAFFHLTLDRPSGFDITLGYLTAGGEAFGEALAGVDYQSSAGTLLVPSGQSTATVEVRILPDLLDEPDESFVVQLVDPVHATLGDPLGTGTILDDDPPPVLSVTDVTIEEAEGAEAVFQLTLSGPSGYDIMATYATADGTAVASLDYTATTGTIEVPAGETATTVVVPVLDDALDEYDETFELVVTDPQWVVLPDGPSTATIVDDDPPPSIAIGDVTLEEAAVDAVFPLELSGPSGKEIRLRHRTADGSARAGADYAWGQGQITLDPGETTATVAVPILDDPTDEPEETFFVHLSDPVDVTFDDAEGLGTIIDDDPPPTLTVSDAQVTEGDLGSVDATFTLALSLPSGFDIGLAYASADGGTASDGTPLRPAISPEDYAAVSSALTIPAGTPSTEVSVRVVGDIVDELDEYFTFTVTDPVPELNRVEITDGTALGKIVDDDEALVSVDDRTVDEGDEGSRDTIFTVDMTNPSDRTVEVSYTTEPGGPGATTETTATEDEDYGDETGSLSFAPGEQEKPLPVSIFGDRLFELDELFEVRLTDVVEAAFLDPRGQGTILDDELCLGPNLVVNGSGESAPVGGELAGWTEVLGTDWTFGLFDPGAADGDAYLVSATSDDAELAQDVDVTAYAGRIDDGVQELRIRAFVGQGEFLPPAETRMVVEFRDATGVLLGDWQSEAPIAVGDWAEVGDDVFVPAGTRTLRVRLLSTATEPSEGNVTNQGHFDAVSVRSLRIPAVWIDDVVAYEADGLPALFPLHLACAVDGENSVLVTTADGTALAPDDYAATSETVLFPRGETESSVEVPIVQDGIDEPAEDFTADLADLLGPYDPILLDASGRGTILDQRRCPRSPGYWKNHTDLWPVEWLRIGAQVYDADGLIELLRTGGPDASHILARQLVATKLNLANGADPFILPVVEEADAFLAVHPPGSDPRGPARSEGLAIKDQLDAYNNLDCEDPDDGSAGGGGGPGDDPGGGPDDGEDDGGEDDGEGDGGEEDDGGEDDGEAETCPRSPGYWKTHHPDAWPVLELELGGVLYGEAELLEFLAEDAEDASLGLAHHLVATKLNLEAGTDPSITPTVEESDAFLAEHPPGSDPKGRARKDALDLKDALDAYNNGSCP